MSTFRPGSTFDLTQGTLNALGSLGQGDFRTFLLTAAIQAGINNLPKNLS